MLAYILKVVQSLHLSLASLAGNTEKIVERVLSGETDANTVHKSESSVTTKVVKLLPIQRLTKDSDQWSGGIRTVPADGHKNAHFGKARRKIRRT